MEMDDYSTIPDDAPRPRLCHMKKWADFNGYGFNLHAERGKAGQFVGTIDLGSPAEVTQLRAGDRIVEVNGTNIGSENHQQVVQRIKAVPNETTLLVVDNDTDAYYRERKVLVRNDMPNIEYHETPDVNPFTHRETAVTNSVQNMKVSEAETTDSAHHVKASDSEPDYERYQARLCRLRLWPDFSGYGFNLHAERSKTGQFIGKVDAQSPALESGLREGDRIIEVNGVSVVEKSHPEVVTLVKSRQGEVDMLVVDSEADDHFRAHDIRVHESMPGVVTITCPANNPYAAAANGGVKHSSEPDPVPQLSIDHDSDGIHSAPGYSIEKSVAHGEESHVIIAENDNPEAERVEDGYEDSANHIPNTRSSFENQTKQELSPASSTPPPSVVTSDVSSVSHVAPPPAPSSSPTPSAAAGGKPVTVGGIEFAGSAKEARERMNKKRNVKTDPSLTLKDKYDILQKL